MPTLVIGYADSINMAGDFKVNICDKIVISVYNIHDQFAMKDSSLSSIVGIFYLGVYWNVELCKVTQEDKNSFSNSFKQPQTDRDSCALTTVWKVITARKLFTMFFTSADHVGNLHQGCNYVCY